MLKWKPDWDVAKQHFTEWWNARGLVLLVRAPLSEPREATPPIPETDDLEASWTDPTIRLRRAEGNMAGTYYGGDNFPYFDTQIGPGSLGTFLGATPHFAPTTVWYEPCIADPDTYGDIEFDPSNHWFRVHMGLIEAGLRSANGRYLVGIPDVIENIDTLAAMRDNEAMLFDLIERPAWVIEKIAQINRAYFQAFDLMYERVKDEEGGNAYAAFGIWGPGKTAKVQCDFSCMISPQMFREFVVPSLTEQCEWLDYSLYHLDGTTAVQHLDALLEIEALNGIQWTPQAGKPGGADPVWYDIYKRVLAAGKCVHVSGHIQQLRPLLDALGTEGVYYGTWAKDPDEAQKLVQSVTG